MCVYIYEVAIYPFMQSLLEEAGISKGTLPRSFLNIPLNDLQKAPQLVNDLAAKISSLSLEFPLKFPPLSRCAGPAVLPQAGRHERGLNSQKGAQETPWFCSRGEKK